MIKIIYSPKHEQDFKELESPRAGTWIFVQEPTEEESLALVETYKLEAGLIADALDPYEVPRVELEGGTTYIFTRIPYTTGQSMVTAPFMIAISGEYVVTISKHPLSMFDQFFDRNSGFSTTQKTKLVLLILAEINRSYQRYTNDIRKQIRKTSGDLKHISNKTIIEFVRFEETLNDFLSALAPTNTLLERILTGKYLALFENDRTLTEDLSLSTEQLIEACRSSLHTIVNIRGAYSIIMTNKLNRIFTILTTFTIVLTIPMVIASLYGMNVDLPFQNSPYAFSGVLIASIALGILVVSIFVKNRWFND